MDPLTPGLPLISNEPPKSFKVEISISREAGHKATTFPAQCLSHLRIETRLGSSQVLANPKHPPTSAIHLAPIRTDPASFFKEQSLQNRDGLTRKPKAEAPQEQGPPQGLGSVMTHDLNEINNELKS